MCVCVYVRVCISHVLYSSIHQLTLDCFRNLIVINNTLFSMVVSPGYIATHGALVCPSLNILANTFLVFLVISILTVWGDHSLWFDLHFPDDYWYWAPFHVSVGHLYVFFWKMPIQVLYQFLIRYMSAINFMNSLSILYTNPLSDLWIANIFPIW